jgi:hypothetical protein
LRLLLLGIGLVCSHRLRDRNVGRVIEGAGKGKLMFLICNLFLLKSALIEIEKLLVELGLTRLCLWS